MSDRIRVMVADDSPLFRELLERTLAPRYEVIEGASTLDEVDAAFERGPIDVALIDLAWRDEGACLPRMKHWRALQPDCHIIIITNYDEWVHCEGCLKHGAAGFIAKADRLNLLDQAIATVRRGELYISPKVTRPPAAATRSTHGTLSRSARRILDLLAEGFTQKQIAKTLGLSVRTVEDHVRAIKDHYGIDSRAKPNWRVLASGMGDRNGSDVV